MTVSSGTQELVNQATGELVTVQSMAPLTVEEILEQRNVITQVLSRVMQEGVHYGKIPGTGNGKSLLKPGADLLLSTFHIATDPIIEDLSSHQEIRYRVKLRGLTMGNQQLVGVGLGEASSNEEKYRWKRTNRNDWNNTPETMRRIKYTEWDGQPKETMQVRANPYDQVNTILKMAKKRAAVDLVLTALAAAEIFDRVDDVLREEESRTRQASTQPSKPGAEAPTGFDERDSRAAAANASQAPPVAETATDQGHGKALNELRRATDQAGMREIDVFAQFNVTGWGGIKPDQVEAVRKWIEEVSP